MQEGYLFGSGTWYRELQYAMQDHRNTDQTSALRVEARGYSEEGTVEPCQVGLG